MTRKKTVKKKRLTTVEKFTAAIIHKISEMQEQYEEPPTREQIQPLCNLVQDGLTGYTAVLFDRLIHQEQELTQLRAFREELQAANTKLVEQERAQRNQVVTLEKAIKEARAILHGEGFEEDLTLRAIRRLTVALVDTKLEHE